MHNIVQRSLRPNIAWEHDVGNARPLARLFVALPQRHARRSLAHDRSTSHLQALGRHVGRSDAALGNDVTRSGAEVLQEPDQVLGDDGADVETFALVFARDYASARHDEDVLALLDLGLGRADRVSDS